MGTSKSNEIAAPLGSWLLGLPGLVLTALEGAPGLGSLGLH